MPGLTFLILPDQSFKTDQAKPGLGCLILNLGEVILANELISPSFDPGESSTCYSSSTFLDIFIFVKSMSLELRIKLSFVSQNPILIDMTVFSSLGMG